MLQSIILAAILVGSTNAVAAAPNWNGTYKCTENGTSVGTLILGSKIESGKELVVIGGSLDLGLNDFNEVPCVNGSKSIIKNDVTLDVEVECDQQQGLAFVEIYKKPSSGLDLSFTYAFLNIGGGVVKVLTQVEGTAKGQKVASAEIYECQK